MTVQERIEAAKKNLEAAEKAKAIAETQLETANKQCDEVIEKMKAYNVTPENIGTEIERLTADVDKQLAEIEASIPEV